MELIKIRFFSQTRIEVNKMDYSGYRNFPFPDDLPKGGEKVKKYFLSLPDETQLQLLNGCLSYGSFYRRVTERMTRETAPAGGSPQ
jgi:hypothetical protein